MTHLQALVLAIVQGVTEFLPISSSGHLILFSRFLGWRDQGLLFDTVVNTGSWAAVLAYFWGDVKRLVVEWVRSLSGGGDSPTVRLAWALVLGTIPVGLVGLFFREWVASHARDSLLIATTSLSFGLLLWVVDRSANQRRQIENLLWTDALWVGLAQAVALIPGTSRSGITMTVALALGFRRPAAARFSFLLAIPVGFLVAAKDVADLASGAVLNPDWGVLAVGLLGSAASAYLVIGWLLRWLRRRSLAPFAIYRILLGLGLLTLALT